MSSSIDCNLEVMSSVESHSYKENSKPTFWKKTTKHVPGSIKPVYGAQHPPIQDMPLGRTGNSSAHSTPKKSSIKGNQKDSFQDFKEKTDDAWDDGEDDLMLMTANVKISLKDVQSTAMQVLSNHSQQIQATNGTTSPDKNYPVLQRSLSESNDTGSSRSAQGTPTHTRSGSTPVGSGPSPGGPGVGVRLPGSRKPQHYRPAAPRFGSMPVPDREASKLEKFKSLLSIPNLDIDELKKLSWSGIPRKYRPTTWKILSGYLPPSLDRREPTLNRKRQEYFNFIDQYFETRHQDLHADTFRQISIDIPRMSPLIPLFQQTEVQHIFERILYIWAIRHPASGYVQGMNDLVTPFFVVYLSEFVGDDVDIDHCDIKKLPQDQLNTIEADCFWCFTKLLDGIQDNYTFAQPGIQKKVNALKVLVSRIDNALHQHLLKQNVEYLQFAFRWMNNLLMREMPLGCVIRLWDTYLAEPEGFASFHLYVCAAFLDKFSQDLLRERDFQGLMLMLQDLPTHNWGNDEIGLLLAEAYKLKFMFADAPKHLQQKK